jgi:CRISPR-associated protein (Cas_Cas02710)
MILEALWLEFKSLEPAARQAFYDTQIFPLVLEGFKDQGARAYDVSLHTLGTSAEPVILAAHALGAKKVILLGTVQTLGVTGRIQTWLPDRDLIALEADRVEANSLYTAVNRELERVPVNASVAIDITGGTKAMVAALSMLAVRLSEQRMVDVYYVNNEAWDSDLRMPKPGGERLVRLEMPSV